MRHLIAALVVPLLAVAFLAAPAVGQGTPPGGDDDCSGDADHHQHEINEIDTSACQRANNPHFPGWVSETGCRDTSRVRTCRGCMGCCNGKMDEKVSCHCSTMGLRPIRQACNRTAERKRGECQGQCGIPFNECDPVGDLEFRLPAP